ncbi:hypothetical protein Tco_1030782 [Tanacetum coccineum]|uniref:Uncharacterized protein n=1 Tax=Tanacetum coccineum TaxID=301880 RepID=A0ABQ5G7I8_9ASTR
MKGLCRKSNQSQSIQRSRPNWLFDIDALTNSINYNPVVAGNQFNGNAGTKVCDNAGKARVETEPRINQEKDASVNSTNNINTVSPTVNAASIEDNVVDENIIYGCVDDPNIPDLEEIGRFSDAKDDGAEADMTNLDTHIPASLIPITRIHKDHPLNQVIGNLQLATQTRQIDNNIGGILCKKKTVVANSTIEAEYVAASSYCGQVLWIQNQLLDYGDSNEKKLIQMIKIHTDKNIADLLTKAFDKGIGVNAGDSKLMLLGINLLLLEKVNAARHNLLLLVVS